MQEIHKYIKYNHINFLREKLGKFHDYIKANLIFKDITGINIFFDSQTSYLFFQKILDESISQVSNSVRREYGDFQTPNELTDNICSLLTKSNFHPQSVLGFSS